MTSFSRSDDPWLAASIGAEQDPDACLCVICGGPLGTDADDVPGPPQGPMCGACARAREFDQTLWELDLGDPDAGLW